MIARAALPQLPYSVDEIYGLRNTTRSSSKYPACNRVHTSVYRIFGSLAFDGGRPEVVIVEDSNSGYGFYRALCEKSGIRCVSAEGDGGVQKGVARFGALVALAIDSFTWICLLASLSKITV